jgi:hypothetical protein
MRFRVVRTFHRFDAVLFRRTQSGSEYGYRIPILDSLFESLFGREVGKDIHGYPLLDTECLQNVDRNEVTQFDQTGGTLRLERVIFRQSLTLRETVIVLVAVLVESGHVESGSESHGNSPMVEGFVL